MRPSGALWLHLVLVVALASDLASAAPQAKPTVSKVAQSPPCEACHGAHGEGIAAAHIPRLAGQSSEYLRKQLDDYASGARDNPIMANFAKELNDKQRVDAADRFAAMSSPYVPSLVTAEKTVLARGRQLAYLGDERRQVQACNSCHGPDGSGVLHSTPYLAGQSSDYLASALKAFQNGSRTNDAGELMRSVAKRLNDSDIAAVGSYYAHAGVGPINPSSPTSKGS